MRCWKSDMSLLNKRSLEIMLTVSLSYFLYVVFSRTPCITFSGTPCITRLCCLLFLILDTKNKLKHERMANLSIYAHPLYCTSDLHPHGFTAASYPVPSAELSLEFVKEYKINSCRILHA